MRLAEPGWLVLLILLPVPWLLERSRPRLAWPSLDAFPRRRTFWARLFPWLPILLKMAAIGCLAVAMARPQEVGGTTRIAGKGVAIILALDHSSSMTATDFPSNGKQVSRLDAAKQTCVKFVLGRSDDPIGLVVFANYPDLATPTTLGHNDVIEAVRAVRVALPGDDGTNLGDAIAESLDDLRKSTVRRKVIILVTDGRNSPAVPHPLDPVEAAVLAREFGVTLYTIAIGHPREPAEPKEPAKDEKDEPPVDAPDYELLERLAKIAGGRAFTAADADALTRVFAKIDAIEKSPVQGQVLIRYRETYAPWVSAALILLILDRLLAAGRLRRLP
jgi:Ca-activated chloride channel family protein